MSVSQLQKACYDKIYLCELPHSGYLAYNILPELSNVLMWYLIDNYNDTGVVDMIYARLICNAYIPKVNRNIIDRLIFDVYNVIKYEMVLPDKNHIINYAVNGDLLKYKILLVERINGLKFIHMPKEIIVNS